MASVLSLTNLQIIKTFITLFSSILVYLSIVFFIFSSTLDGLYNVPLFLYIIALFPFCIGLGVTLITTNLLNLFLNYGIHIMISGAICSVIFILYYGIKFAIRTISPNDVVYITFVGIFTAAIFGFLSFFIWLTAYGGIILQSILSFIIQIYKNIIGFKNVFSTDGDFRAGFIQTFLSFTLLFLALFLFFYYTTYHTMTSQQTYFCMFGIVSIFLYLFVNKDMFEFVFIRNKWATIVLFILGFLGYASYEMIFKNMSNGTADILKYTSIAIGVFIGIIALAILFIVFRKMFSEATGPLAILIHFLFYIPCLFIDFIQYMKNEIRMTSNSVYILFIIEVILILLYSYIPYFKSQIENNDAIILFSDAMFLNKSEQIGNNNMYKTPRVLPQGETPSIDGSDTVYRTNYAFTFWVYVNPQQHEASTLHNTNETPIFDFGNKPTFSYVNGAENTLDGNGNPTINDKFAIHFTNTDSSKNEPVYITLEKQKWHYIAFNYFSDRAELYLDGTLYRTVSFADKQPTYSTSDVVTLGYKNGLYGAICNVKYYKSNMIPENISRIYNLLMFSNPPTDT